MHVKLLSRDSGAKECFLRGGKFEKDKDKKQKETLEKINNILHQGCIKNSPC
jgi:hypothetical protein